MIRAYTAFFVLFSITLFPVPYCDGAASGNSNALFPEGVESNQLGLFVKCDRTTDEQMGEYVQGMPIIVNIRIVNLPAKRNVVDAKKLRIASVWSKVLQLEIVADDKTIINTGFCLIPTENLLADSITELFKNDLSAEWILDSDQTKPLRPGQYVLVAKLGAFRREVPLFILERQAENDPQVAVRQAWSEYRKKDYNNAINIAEQAMDTHGKMVCDRDNYAMIIVAQAKEKLGNDQDALRLYEEFMTNYIPRNFRQESDLIKFKIVELKNRIQEKNP